MKILDDVSGVLKPVSAPHSCLAAASPKHTSTLQRAVQMQVSPIFSCTCTLQTFVPAAASPVCPCTCDASRTHHWHIPPQGRLTLLMGPPGSGKSVFLKALGGRLKPSSELRTSGSIRYNGLDTSDFCVERAIGLVDQYDDRV